MKAHSENESCAQLKNKQFVIHAKYFWTINAKIGRNDTA